MEDTDLNIDRLIEHLQHLLDDTRADDTKVTIERADLESLLKHTSFMQVTATQLRGLLETAPDAIVGVSKAGGIVMINEQTVKMFRYTREELLGNPVEMLIPERYTAKHVSHREEYAHNPRTRPMGQQLDLVGRRKGGDEFPVEISLSSLDMGDEFLVISIIRDITSRKQLEENLRRHTIDLEEQVLQAERLVAVGRMAAQVAHEIRNPLSSIGLNIELLADDIREQQWDKRDEAEELIQISLSEIERLNNVINDYLQFARMPEHQLEEVFLNGLVIEQVKFVRPEATQAHVVVDHSLEQNLPSVRIDPVAMRQAVLNCIRNAIEAMPDGGTLTVFTRLRDGQLELSFSDTGSGIHPDHQMKVFDPFYSTKDQGTGLGLPYVRQIVSEYGGQVELDSNPDQGTTILIKLPIEQVVG